MYLKVVIIASDNQGKEDAISLLRRDGFTKHVDIREEYLTENMMVKVVSQEEYNKASFMSSIELPLETNLIITPLFISRNEEQLTKYYDITRV